MISHDDAAEAVQELTDALTKIRSPRAKASVERALQIATAIEGDLAGNPNVVVRTASATFEMSDLVPLLPVGEPTVEP